MTADDQLASLARTLRRISRWIAGFVAMVGLWFLALWFRGKGLELAFSGAQVPTAPATALIALLLALGIIACARPHQEDPSIAAKVLPALALGLSLWLGIAYLVGVEVALERWLAGPPMLRDGVPLGRISVITAALFAIIASALLVGQSKAREYEGAIATLALAAALVVLQGYVLGAPLLYGSKTIPVAAPSALLLWLLAFATLLRTDPTHWPLRVVLPTGRIGVLPTARNFIWLALLFASVVISTGYFWYAAQREQAEQRAVSTLRTVADLKASEIALWYAGIRTTVMSLGRAPLDADLLRSTSTADRDERRRTIEAWLRNLRTEQDFEAVALVSPEGERVAYVAAPDARPVTRLDTQFWALSGDSLQVTPVYASGDAIRRTFWVPLHSAEAPRGRPIAWLAFIVAIDRALYPRLAEFPANFRTGDFSLWPIERDSVRLLSPPRDADIRPLQLTLPLDSATEADIYGPLASDEGYEGPGFTQQRIRAVQREVPGTPWQLVAKVDHDELQAPVLAAAIRATAVSLFFLLGAGAVIYALWYRRDLARTQRELALIEAREHDRKEIEASEQRYARVMRGTTDGLWDMNMVTGEAYVSERWREIAGIPGDSAIRSEEDFLQFIHPDDVPKQRAAMVAHLERGEPYDVELRLKTEPGEMARWIRTRADIERDADGRPVWMSGAITDITRRRNAEEELRRTARLLRVRSAINQAIVRADTEDALLHMICEILVHDGGYRMAWIGRRVDDADRSVAPAAVAGEERGYLAASPVSWGDNEHGQGPTGRCIRSGVPQVAQRLLTEANYAPWREAAMERGYGSSLSIPLNVDGETFGALMIYAAEPDAFDGAELELLTALGLDVSFGISAQRKDAALLAQRDQLTLFRQAIDRSADAIFVADVATGKFVDFNTACLHQLGYTAAELAELGPADVVVDLGSRGGLTVVANGVRASGGMVRASVHRRKDGRDVPVEVALSVLDLGTRTLILGIARDVSDRLKADADREELQLMLNRAQKMESVGRLAGGVAHDFNNLLTVINATAELSLSEAEEGSALHHDLQEIRASGERAAALTRQLLAFSRQQVLKREVLSLNDVVSGFLTLLSRVLGEDIHVEVRLGRDVPHILADKNQLEQVLMNLCVNARDAMPRGGTLTIGCGIAQIDDEHAARREGMTAGPYATLSVTDTGIGMDKATQAKIFEPFFTTKETGRGTGLGLSTVYGIVKQTGGSIYVYSEVGKGTTFRIYLPITDEAAPEHPSGKTAAPTTGQETILVVEDEESIRMVARRVLQRAGYSVLEAESGVAALELLKQHDGPLDLVMTDLVMPGMGGIELAAELRKSRPALKLLFTSGYSAEAVSDQFMHEGDWNFISKPYGLKELAAEVRRVLDS
ncbi:MAG: hypothetical protein C0503_00015 [Gemmatimonas sp.]|nr:hypothetical protein [Gemmatimonas sp.]